MALTTQDIRLLGEMMDTHMDARFAAADKKWDERLDARFAAADENWDKRLDIRFAEADRKWDGRLDAKFVLFKREIVDELTAVNREMIQEAASQIENLNERVSTLERWRSA